VAAATTASSYNCFSPKRVFFACLTCNIIAKLSSAFNKVLFFTLFIVVQYNSPYKVIYAKQSYEWYLAKIMNFHHTNENT